MAMVLAGQKPTRRARLAAQLQLGRLSGTAPTLSGGTATHCRATEDAKGSFGGLVLQPQIVDLGILMTHETRILGPRVPIAATKTTI